MKSEADKSPIEGEGEGEGGRSGNRQSYKRAKDKGNELTVSMLMLLHNRK